MSIYEMKIKTSLDTTNLQGQMGNLNSGQAAGTNNIGQINNSTFSKLDTILNKLNSTLQQFTTQLSKITTNSNIRAAGRANPGNLINLPQAGVQQSLMSNPLVGFAGGMLFDQVGEAAMQYAESKKNYKASAGLNLIKSVGSGALAGGAVGGLPGAVVGGVGMGLKASFEELSKASQRAAENLKKLAEANERSIAKSDARLTTNTYKTILDKTKEDAKSLSADELKDKIKELQKEIKEEVAKRYAASSNLSDPTAKLKEMQKSQGSWSEADKEVAKKLKKIIDGNNTLYDAAVANIARKKDFSSIYAEELKNKEDAAKAKKDAADKISNSSDALNISNNSMFGAAASISQALSDQKLIGKMPGMSLSKLSSLKKMYTGMSADSEKNIKSTIDQIIGIKNSDEYKSASTSKTKEGVEALKKLNDKIKDLIDVMNDELKEKARSDNLKGEVDSALGGKHMKDPFTWGNIIKRLDLKEMTGLGGMGGDVQFRNNGFESLQIKEQKQANRWLKSINDKVDKIKEAGAYSSGAVFA